MMPGEDALDVIFFAKWADLSEDCVANQVRKPFVEEVARQIAPGHLIFVTLPHSRFRPVTAISQLGENITLVKPWMPIVYRLLYVSAGNRLRPLVRRVMDRQLAPVLTERRFGNRRPAVAIFGHPLLGVFRGLVRERLSVYECIDDYARMGRRLAHLDPLVRREEMQFASRCDLVLVSARTLYHRLTAVSSHIHYMPNACEFPHFEAALGAPSEGMPVLNFPKPRIGFMGNLHRWLDFSIIRGLVKQFSSGSVLFLGEVTPRDIEDDLAWLKARPNVHFLGWRPWKEVPLIVRQFDVAIIPFKMNPLTDAVSPDKLFQYWALGLPVVATPTHELKQFGHMLYLAEPEEFCQAIALALREPPEKRDARIAFVRERHTWQIRVRELLQVVWGLLDENRNLPQLTRRSGGVSTRGGELGGSVEL